MASARIRLVARGALAAAVSTFVALLSHVAGGGTVPAVAGIAVPLVLSIAVCTFLGRLRFSTLGLVLSVGASQLLFHVLFVLGASTGVAVGGSGAHAHGMADSVVLLGTASPLHPHGDGITMWIAHGLAAALTVIALRRGERAIAHLRTVGRIAITRLLGAIRVRPIAAPCTVSIVGATRVVSRRVRLVHLGALPRRGPPLRAAA